MLASYAFLAALASTRDIHLSSYSTALPHQILMSTWPSCYGPHLITYHCRTTAVPSNNMLRTCSSSRLIRLLYDQVSLTATIELDYWPSLRQTAAPGCTPSPWLHVEQDSTTKQFGLQSGCASDSTYVNLICVIVAHWWTPRTHMVYPASAVQAINPPLPPQ